MFAKNSYVVARSTLVILFLAVCGCALSQQATPEPTPMEAAKQKLEDYRKSKMSIWMSDFGELARYHDANASLKPPAPGENRVVFMGDSITDIWHLADSFPGKPYINRGIGGQTTPQMLIRFRPEVIDLQAKVVVILGGTNDIAGNTGPMTLEETEENLASMAELARFHHIRVVLSSLVPVNDYTPAAESFFLQRPPEKILQLNTWIKNYCAKNGYLYLDYFGAMVDDKGMLKREITEDGLHPNPAGYAIMAPLAEAAIKKALAVP